MSGARAVTALTPGAWVDHDGGRWRVVALDGLSVLLVDVRGRERQVLTEYLLSHPSTRPVVNEEVDTTGAGVLFDLPEPVADELDDRVGHVREVLTGFRSGHPETAKPGEPMPAYAPDRPLLDRYTAKAAELGVGVRTVRRWVANYRAGGDTALLDQRWTKTQDRFGCVDGRWLAVCREMLDEHTDASTPTKLLVLERVHARLVERFGEDVVPEPGKTTAYELLGELARGRNTFSGSSKGRRSIAGRPTGTFGRLRATRPGEYLVLDTSPLDVFAMEPVTLRWLRCELTIAFDLMTRCVAGLRLTPVSTKAVDAAGVVFDAVRPKTCDPAWAPEARWPYLGIPTTLVVDADQLVEGRELAGLPVIAPETLVIDHGKIYLSRHLEAVCARLGISIQPARPYTPTDKAPLERFFRTLREGLLAALPGYKGPDVYSRGADIEGHAFYFMDELEAIIREWVAVVYHRRPHAGLALGEAPGVELSPNDMYSWGVRRAGFVNIPAHPHLVFDFLPVVWRQIHHYGVEVNGLRYNGPALDAYRQATSPYTGIHTGKWPLRVDAADVTRLWFEDPDTHEWSPLTWEHAGAVGGPFSADALDYAKQLVASGDRFGDVRVALRDLLERWDAGLARNPTERRILTRASHERTGLLGPSPTPPAAGDSDAGTQALATVRALFPADRPLPEPVPAGAALAGDDDDEADLDDVPDEEFYADAFEVLE